MTDDRRLCGAADSLAHTCADYAFTLCTPPTHTHTHTPHFLKNVQTTEKCSAEVLFARGEGRHPAQVQASCGELPKTNTQAQEEAFYQKCKTNQSLLLAQNLPGVYEKTACRITPKYSTTQVPVWLHDGCSDQQIATATLSQTWCLCGTWALWPPASSC